MGEVRELVFHLLNVLISEGMIVIEEEGGEKVRVRRVEDESGGICKVLRKKAEREEHS